MHAFDWLRQPGLAGGIDNDGSRSEELLGLGFGSVEFGSVQAHNVPALGERLVAATASHGKSCAIGVGLGLDAALEPAHLGAQWCLGVHELGRYAGTVDYLSLNLSAAANRRFLTPALGWALQDALERLQGCRHALPLPLAVKLPVADALRLAPVWPAAGFAQLTVVLPEGGELSELRALRAVLPAVKLVAVGGMRDGADVARARAAGADGVQVHRLFRQYGGACLARLRSDTATMARP